MIFEYVVLHNFGAYRGAHRIDLEVTREQPVVLIGALNGSGKTTFLDAMQLALYGKSARCSGRESVSYPEYLESMINRDAPPNQGAGVELAFRARANGKDMHIRISRTWVKRGAGIRESLEIYRDYLLDAVASERWIEFVEDFMPSQIADLFFFDGEKIEALADPQRSGALLKEGIHSLLGIDLVESLERSLKQIERSRKIDTSSERDKEALQAIEAQRAEVQQSIEAMSYKLGSIQNDLDRLEKQEQEALSEFKRLGGDLLSKRDGLLADQKRFSAHKATLEEELRTIAAGSLPLMIPRPTLKLAISKANAAKRSRHAEVLRTEAEARDEAIITFVRSLGLTEEAHEQLQTYLAGDRRNRYPRAKHTSFPAEKLLEQYKPESVEAARLQAQQTLQALTDCEEQLAAVDRHLAAVPSLTDVAPIQQELEQLRAERAKTEAILTLRKADIEAMRSKLERLKAQADREAERLGEQLIKDEVSQRVIAHSARGRETLARFREALLRNNLNRLENAIRECFQRLIRKKSLIHAIAIDPATFQLTVTNTGGQIVPSHRLSAGERQLLAVATLWALAIGSGRRLPTVIDTPLSRLDSKHRGTLVQNYFPTASHQVILLSTDEEVIGRYKEMLAPSVGKYYLIENDEAAGTSRFLNSYFPSEGIEASA